jgi:hypothetical protein
MKINLWDQGKNTKTSFSSFNYNESIKKHMWLFPHIERFHSFPLGSTQQKSWHYYISDLIDRHIDFDQWEFCVVWATRISFHDVLSAFPPFS